MSDYLWPKYTSGSKAARENREAMQRRQQAALPAKSFNPILRNTHGVTWEASQNVAGFGMITTRGLGWEEARLRLWLVIHAIEAFKRKPCKDMKDWSDDEWRSTLKAMAEAIGDEPAKNTPKP